MALEIKVDTKRLERVFQTCPQELDRVMPGIALRIGQRYLGFWAARRLRGPPGVRGTRDGIRKQFSVDVTGSKFDNLRVSIFSTSPVVKIHEFGGTTVSKGGGLAVPFSSLSKAEKKRAKLLLRQTRNVLNAKSQGFNLFSAKGRKVKGLFVIQARNGKKYLAEAIAGRKPKFLFHLEPRVVNRPLLGFRALWKTYVPQAIKLFNQGIGFALQNSRKKAGAGRQVA